MEYALIRPEKNLPRATWSSTRLPLLAAFCCVAVSAQPTAREPDPFPFPERFSHYLYRTYSWQRMAWLGLDTGFDFTLGGARGLNGLLHSYGDGFGCRIVRNSTEFALAAVLREDARYKGLYEGGIRRRLRHATVRAFQASVPGAQYRPAYSRFAAIAAGELVSPVWRTRGAPGPEVLSAIVFGVLGQAENNYLSEFTPELRAVGRKVGKKLRRMVQRPPWEAINRTPAAR